MNNLYNNKITARTIWPYLFDIFFVSFIAALYITLGDLPEMDGNGAVVIISYSLSYIAIAPLYGIRIGSIVAIIRRYKKPMHVEKIIAKLSIGAFLVLIVPGLFSSSIWASAHSYKSCFRIERRAPLYLYVPMDQECPPRPSSDQYHLISPNPYLEMYRNQ